jgi:hypothetical protein
MSRRNQSPLAAASFAAALLLAGASARGDEPQAGRIASKMNDVVDELGRKQTGAPVQTEQKEIVRNLDDLIASLERQCENCKGGIKANRPRRGMDESMIRSGTGGSGPLGNPDDAGKDWGKLSDRERDRILQSMSEGFPPEYRTVLERYYRRLAEEKSAKAPKSDGAAKDQAAPAEPAAKP